MKSSFAIIALAAATLAEPIPQGVTGQIAPPAGPPAGCSLSTAGTFEITVVQAPAKRNIEERQKSGTLTLTLSGGVLHDQAGRTGYIASNYQFQFDAPPQTGAIYTAGFSLCSNGSLALGGSTVFYECKSGSFYNLYDRSWAAQCSPINIVSTSGGSGGSGGSPPTGATTVVSQISDGQPQGQTPAPVSEQSDGQPTATAAPPPAVSEQSDGQPTATAAPPPAVSEQSDGQPTATAAPPPAVSEQSDGQPTATAAPPPVSEKSEGQPVATSAPPAVSEKSEGQPVATSAAPPPVSEKSEGQPVATSAPPAVSEKSEGQPVATSTAAITSSVAPVASSAPASSSLFTGAAATPVQGIGAVAAGILGLVALL